MGSEHPHRKPSREAAQEGRLADSQFWRELALSFRQLLASCDKPLNVEWSSINSTPAKGGGKDAWWMFGEGGGRNCGKQFFELASRAGKKLFPSNPNSLQTWLFALASYSKPLPPKDRQRGTDSRLEDVVRLSVEYCERIAAIEGTTERPSFANFVIPEFRYFPSLLMDKQGPKQWARLRLLQACERLKMPSDLWPVFKDLDLPRQQFAFTQQISQPFPIPAFNRLYESEAEWRERTHKDLDLFLDKYTGAFEIWFQQQISQGNLTKIKTIRSTSPLELRYEWAAQRYCLRKQFKEMQTDKYSAERIRKVVLRIFAETGLRDRK